MTYMECPSCHRSVSTFNHGPPGGTANTLLFDWHFGGDGMPCDYSQRAAPLLASQEE